MQVTALRNISHRGEPHIANDGVVFEMDEANVKAANADPDNPMVKVVVPEAKPPKPPPTKEEKPKPAKRPARSWRKPKDAD